MARQVAAAHPGLVGGEHPGGDYTDVGVLIRQTFKGLVLDSQPPPGSAAQEQMGYWHQPTDTIDKIEPETLTRVQTFVWRLLEAIDQEAARSKPAP